MTAYAPSEARVVAELAIVAVVLLAAGFAAAWLRPSLGRAASWCLVVSSVAVADRLTRLEAPGFRMLALCALLLIAMKGLVLTEARARDGVRLSLSRWLAFALLWPGMRPGPFARHGRALPGAAPLLLRGLVRVMLGLALVFVARWIVARTGSFELASLALLPGLSLLLHFGAFNLAAGGWRLLGVDCGPLFRAPLAARGLGEFWGRRWNLAFSEMTALAAYRPVAAMAGRPVGIVASFLLSGLLHEIAISLPVRAGFGGPLAYFLLHGLLVAVEKQRGAFGRPVTLAALALPLPILFHRPFLEGVVWPLLGASSAMALE